MKYYQVPTIKKIGTWVEPYPRHIRLILVIRNLNPFANHVKRLVSYVECCSLFLQLSVQLLPLLTIVIQTYFKTRYCQNLKSD